jgi:hypothetical protein
MKGIVQALFCPEGARNFFQDVFVKIFLNFEQNVGASRQTKFSLIKIFLLT